MQQAISTVLTPARIPSAARRASNAQLLFRCRTASPGENKVQFAKRERNGFLSQSIKCAVSAVLVSNVLAYQVHAAEQTARERLTDLPRDGHLHYYTLHVMAQIGRAHV